MDMWGRWHPWSWSEWESFSICEGLNGYERGAEETTKNASPGRPSGARWSHAAETSRRACPRTRTKARAFGCLAPKPGKNAERWSVGRFSAVARRESDASCAGDCPLGLSLDCHHRLVYFANETVKLWQRGFSGWGYGSGLSLFSAISFNLTAIVLQSRTIHL